MVGLPRKKSRLLALTGLVFLAQCCCWIMPLSKQVEQNPPPLSQMVERISENFRASFDSMGPELLSRVK